MSKDYSRKKSNNSTAKNSAKQNSDNRKKRRAERNRIRTIKHIHKLLDQIVEGIDSGFNHHGWCNAATALKQASMFLDPQEYQAIGDLWAPLYVESRRSNEELVSVVSRIKERIAGDLLEML